MKIYESLVRYCWGCSSRFMILNIWKKNFWIGSISTEHLKFGFNTCFSSFCGKLYCCRKMYCEFQDIDSPQNEGFKSIVFHYNNSLHHRTFRWITDYKIYLFPYLKYPKKLNNCLKLFPPLNHKFPNHMAKSLL